jgi:hypothetical protein
MAAVTLGCSDFLDKESKTALTEEVVFADINNIVPLVEGLYTNYRNNAWAGRGGMNMLQIGTDETQQGNFQLISGGEQPGLDKYNGLLSSMSPQVSEIWNRRFPMVVTAAKVIDVLSKQPESDQVNNLLGEASFFRGLLMFELSMYFGEIPIIDIARADELTMGRRPLNEVWRYIIDDFRRAAVKLPDRQNKQKRATSGAAWAMLGKAYMCAPQATELRSYDSAKYAFEQVMSKGYLLVANYADLWVNDQAEWGENYPFAASTYTSNSSESIFELQFENAWPNQNYWEFDMGSRAIDAWFGQGCYIDGYDFIVPTPFCYSWLDPAKNPEVLPVGWDEHTGAPTKYTNNYTTEPHFWHNKAGLWEDADTIRRNVCLRYTFGYKKRERRTVDGETIVEDVLRYPDLSKTEWGLHDQLLPHIRKWEDLRTDEKHGDWANMWNSAKNHPMIRLADIYLLYAECLYRTNSSGVDGDHSEYIMKVRRRAGLTTAMPDSHDGDFIKNIMDERMRELCFEGHRRIDLLRTGLLRELVSVRNQWTYQEHGGAVIDHHFERYPIPNDEIQTNEDLKNAAGGVPAQNEGYN